MHRNRSTNSPREKEGELNIKKKSMWTGWSTSEVFPRLSRCAQVCNLQMPHGKKAKRTCVSPPVWPDKRDRRADQLSSDNTQSLYTHINSANQLFDSLDGQE